MSDDYETVEVEYDDGITTVTLNRPENKNAMNPTLHAEMCEVLARAKEDALDPEGGTNVLVITGAGDAFCAGQDLEEFFYDNKDDPWAKRQVSDWAMEWGRALWEFPSPTIGMINGWAVGGGLRVACSTDIAIASDEARFSLSEVNWGIFPAGGSTYVPSSMLLKRDFLYLSLTGEPVDAEKAYDMRLVNEVVPASELQTEVYDLAETINETNPLAVQFAKDAYLKEQQSHMTYDAAIAFELAMSGKLSSLQDAENMRAAKAFKEGRYKPALRAYQQEDIEDIE